MFDAETGRWLSGDPLGFGGGTDLFGLDGVPTVDVDHLGLTGSPHEDDKKTAIGKTISQKQLRHIKDRPEWIARGKGSYLNSVDDAQKVLDAYHSGDAKVLGTTKQGHVLVQYEGVTGFNTNPGAGFFDQPTNVFIIKGTSSPSVVPTSPTLAS